MRDTVEEEELVRGESQQAAHPRVELGERALQVRSEPPVEVAPPAERAVNDLGAQPGIARIELCLLERVLERDVGEGAVLLDADQDAERLVARA